MSQKLKEVDQELQGGYMNTFLIGCLLKVEKTIHTHHRDTMNPMRDRPMFLTINNHMSFRAFIAAVASP